MKVPFHIVEARRESLASWMRNQPYAGVHAVCDRFNVSEATARRDLAALAANKRIVRTYGGAIGEYHQRFPSFHERRNASTSAKRQIAEAACQFIKPGTTIFLDAGSTIHAIAEELQRLRPTPLNVITNSLPVAEFLVSTPGVEVRLLGGQLIPRQSVLLGDEACESLRHYQIDDAFLSAQGADTEGLWNSIEQIITLQRAVLKHAKRSTLCLDGTKLGKPAPCFLAPWKSFDRVVSESRSAKQYCDPGQLTVARAAKIPRKSTHP